MQVICTRFSSHAGTLIVGDLKKTVEIMGKDREGKFHPSKGKPSGTRTQKGVTTTNSSTLDQQLEIEDKYTEQADTDSVAPNVRLRHPNRNVDKGHEKKVSDNKKAEANKSVTDTVREELTKVAPDELSVFLSKNALDELANYTSDCCISVYLPTHRAGVEVNEQMDPIAFKNALQEIEGTLKERDFSDTQVARMLKPGYDLLRNDKFWYAMTDGFAAFIADGFFKYMKLPSDTTEKTVINTSFYLSPLVPYMLSKEYFYLLVLSKKQAKLYRADNFGMRYIELKEMPRGVDDVVKLFRTGSSGAGEGANYHGIGAGKPDDKENITMYLDEVDETLWKEILHNEHVPLALAGVEYILPLFRKVTQYKHVWDKCLTGNFEYTDDPSLYKQAREIMEPYFRERVNKAKTTYGNHSATALTSSIPDDVIPAAYYARVSQLFIEKNAQIWGTFDEQNNKLVIHDNQQLNDDSLTDKAVIKTILNGGEVFVLEREDMPVPSALAALMRYESSNV
jgi:hypothetical protein